MRGQCQTQVAEDIARLRKEWDEKKFVVGFAGSHERVLKVQKASLSTQVQSGKEDVSRIAHHAERTQWK